MILQVGIIKHHLAQNHNRIFRRCNPFLMMTSLQGGAKNVMFVASNVTPSRNQLSCGNYGAPPRSWQVKSQNLFTTSRYH